MKELCFFLLIALIAFTGLYKLMKSIDEFYETLDKTMNKGQNK